MSSSFSSSLPMLSLLENTMLPMDYTNSYPAAERPKRALELLRHVGLEAYADSLPTAVSSGQQQSAAIARALATDPPIIVADEPTGNLDTRSANNIIDLFKRLVEEGKTILIVTHDPSITELTERTVIISDGELIDENVARALPLLNHRQLMAVTRLIQRSTVQPGAEILPLGDPVAHFFIVARGEVEVVLQTRRSPELVVARLCQGQFFGEVELVRGWDSIASIRAAEESSGRAADPAAR